MASTRISLVRGTAKTYEIDLTDEDGEPLPSTLLDGASAIFNMKTSPSAPTNTLGFTTAANPASLYFSGSAVRLVFVAGDTDALPLLVYSWQLIVTLSDGNIVDAVEWSPFDLNEGGTTVVTPPTFSNTVKLDQNYGTPNALQYQTAGGSPISNAQIRVYYKTDYDAGRLDTPVGISLTDASGNWAAPVLVLPGFSYTIQFFKPNEYGPDASTIIA